MQSDKQQMSNSYLRNSLVDGARPFHYRKEVRLLLGFPESGEGNMAFSPTLPAIGFGYVNRPIPNEFCSVQDLRNETDWFALNSEQEGETENSLVSPRENVQSYEPFDEVNLNNPGHSEKRRNREISQRTDSKAERVQQDGAVTEPERNDGSGAPKEKSEEGNMAFSPTLPAIGFGYVNRPIPNEFCSVQDLRNETGRLASNSEQEGETGNSLVSPLENIQSYEPFDEVRLNNPGRSEKRHDREISKRTDSRAERVQQDGAVTEPEQNGGSGAPKEKGEEDNTAFSQTLPAIGFGYVNRPIPSEFCSVQDLRSETGRFASNSEQEGETGNSLVSPRENVQSYEPFDELSLNNPGHSEKRHDREISQRTDSKAERVQQDNTITELKRNQGSGLLKETPEDPGVIVGKSTIKIPGISEKTRSVPSIHMKEWNTRPSSPEDIVQQEVSPKSSFEDFIESSSSDARENTSAINPPGTSVSATKSLQRKGTVKEKTAIAPSPSKRGDSLVENNTKAVKEKTTTAKKNEFSQITTPVTVVSGEKCMSRSNQTADTAPSRSSYIDVDVFSGANRKASERIEQLQHAVHKLASKISSQQAGISHEARQEKPAQAQSPPVRPVIIIKRFSNQKSTPCAFWERSYLSRFHLKTLR